MRKCRAVDVLEVNTPGIGVGMDIRPDVMDFDSSRIRTAISRPTDTFNADSTGVSTGPYLRVGRRLNLQSHRDAFKQIRVVHVPDLDPIAGLFRWRIALKLPDA
jgi:hypothetical protein